ncbi:C39 family peptidase [Oscillatoria sp. CS-180]|uniref:C39 family peptidase n=1 Tax=Oscillatoria sp. CS-180 TaxID=3021720 RepID=UPI00232B74D6|nr:C39 family peptidase [Oscillatoria sp. CS-180]MDB9527068.1 C39 family peptidase [Oscillatoria sp. CS-180]
MPTVTANATTVLKAKNIHSTELQDSEKIVVPEGQEFFVTHFGPDQNNHMSMRLASPLLAADRSTKLQEVFGYIPHFEFTGSPNRFTNTHDTNKLIKLDVPYFFQRDNDWHTTHGGGWRHCNLTCHAMLVDFLLKGELTRLAEQKGIREPEGVYADVLAKYGNTTDHHPHPQALKDFGIEAYFSYSLSNKDLMRSLQAGIPVVIGVDYKDSGHFCCVVGHDPDQKGYIVHDPNGVRYGASDMYDTSVKGAFDFYSYSLMKQIFWVEGAERGWGTIVTSVKGRPTGLPQGL